MRAVGSKWDRRIERAHALAAAHPAAAEGLRFYERIAGFQRSLYADLEGALGSGLEARPPGSLREELDLGLLLPAFPGFLALVEAAAPAPLSRSTAERPALGLAVSSRMLHRNRSLSSVSLAYTLHLGWSAGMGLFLIQPPQEYL